MRTLNKKGDDDWRPERSRSPPRRGDGQLIVKDASGKFRAELPQIMKPLRN